MVLVTLILAVTPILLLILLLLKLEWKPTFCVKIVIDAEVEEQGRVCFDSSVIIPYLKNFAEKMLLFQ